MKWCDNILLRSELGAKFIACKDSSDSVMKIAVISLHIYSILHGIVMRKTLAP